MKDITLFQIIIITISLLLFSRKLFAFFVRKISIRELGLALIIWGSFGLIATFPVILTKFAKILGFELGSNAVLVISVITLFYIVLKQRVQIDKLENSITRLVREIGLDEVRDKGVK